MNLDATLLEHLGRHLVDADTYKPAPSPLLSGVAYLAGGLDLEQCVCTMRSSDSLVEWAAAWIAGPRIGFASVSKVAKEWDGHSQDQVADDSVAWTRRIADVVELGAHALNFTSLPPFHQRWESHVFPTARWADGIQLRLPLFDHTPQRREREAISALAVALRNTALAI